jgi:transcriptional regulator
MPRNFDHKNGQVKTIRQQIFSWLCHREMTAKDLSMMVKIPEKEVSIHLKHIEKSAVARGKTLVVHPFECLSCGYLFKERKRFTRPGRCPKCRDTHVDSPVFRIVQAR